MAEYMLSYIGSSMFPTLKPGDILRVRHYKHEGIRVGDVIAFHRPFTRALIVHRVVAVDQRGVRTKGDNSSKNDAWVLSPKDIVGRIVLVLRGRKTITLFNGFWGQKYVRAVQVQKCINRGLLSVTLSPPYHWLAGRGVFKKLFSDRANIRLYCFKRGDAMELQLLLGRRVVGRLSPGEKQWDIRRPFRLFLDEAALPINISGDLISSQHAPLQPSGH